MFANIGWGEMLLLVVVGLVVLGPERLPGAISWAAGAIRQARDYLTGATKELREELGPEFEDLRQPLSELQKLRGMTPGRRSPSISSTATTRCSPAISTARRRGRSAASGERRNRRDARCAADPGAPAPFDSDAT